MPLVDPVTMSSSITKGLKSKASNSSIGSSSSTPSPTKQELQPVQTKQTPSAQAARYGSLALLTGVFLASFPALIAKSDDDVERTPVSAMRITLPVVTAIQLGYALLCLPVAGSSSSSSSSSSQQQHHASSGGSKPARKLVRPGEKKLKSSDGAGGPNVIVASLLSLLLTAFATIPLYIAMILFGAPFLTHVPHTLVCAAHLAALALFPLFYTHGVETAAWAQIASFRAPFDETFGGLVGAVVGAWLGAVPIPLDWDREWQKWPVTILCGIYGGYLVGRVVGGTLVFGKRF
ncbi:GPI biosynthesis protein family Pig-F-domain-containing protein [Bombardia bombarda]|uniref:GPI biosynthesis protein family Pig-F-domain-containing protein n=1 Tax=Bombardia bombarda TaxID=252184 RepID=A0AA39WIK1_9PEZI|nr:GPI biosynthesis protein family Pig-F-domain-containing protein [Bombardia bombarda]